MIYIVKTISYYTFLSILKKRGWMLSPFFIVYNLMSYFYINTLSDFFVPEIFLSSNISFYNFLAILFALIWCYSETGSEIKNKKNYITLGKGIARSYYILGKYLGVLSFLILNSVFIYIVTGIEVFFTGGNVFSVLAIFIASTLRLAIFTAVFTGLNSILSFSNSFGAGILIYGISQFLYISNFDNSDLLIKGLKIIAPSEIYFGEVERAFLANLNIPVIYFLFIFMYSFLYIFIILNIFIYFFNRKEI